MKRRLIMCCSEYSRRIDDAAKRMRKGERQAWCKTCNRWRWHDECEHEKQAKP